MAQDRVKDLELWSIQMQVQRDWELDRYRFQSNTKV